MQLFKSIYIWVTLLNISIGQCVYRFATEWWCSFVVSTVSRYLLSSCCSWWSAVVYNRTPSLTVSTTEQCSRLLGPRTCTHPVSCCGTNSGWLNFIFAERKSARLIEGWRWRVRKSWCSSCKIIGLIRHRPDGFFM